MRNIKYVIFDCMETIIDMTELPNLRDYAMSPYKGSCCEIYWEDFLIQVGESPIPTYYAETFKLTGISSPKLYLLVMITKMIF